MEDHNNARRMIEAHERQVRLAKNPSECQYLDILRNILDNGERCKNRTGIDTLALPHLTYRHDMSTGFPLLTTKKMGYKSIKVELEFFIKGLKSKKWLQERGCKIWNEWANPTKIPAGLNDEDRKKAQLVEDDLGECYGRQWRQFNGDTANAASDQLKTIVETLHKNPDDRRMVCSAWNPLQLKEMALPACHFVWVVTKIGKKIHLSFHMRSIDTFLGLPYNIASYATLFHLLSKESGLEAGILTGYLDNVHLYENHLAAVREQLEREPYQTPRIETNKFTSIFDWTHEDTKLIDYQSHDAIKADVAV